MPKVKQATSQTIKTAADDSNRERLEQFNRAVQSFKPLKHCTFDNAFRIGPDSTQWWLACSTAVENLKHLGQVLITNGCATKWVSWNTRVEIVA